MPDREIQSASQKDRQPDRSTDPQTNGKQADSRIGSRQTASKGIDEPTGKPASLLIGKTARSHIPGVGSIKLRYLQLSVPRIQ